MGTYLCANCGKKHFVGTRCTCWTERKDNATADKKYLLDEVKRLTAENERVTRERDAP